MFCTNCGNKLKNNVTFCTNCGQKLVSDNNTQINNNTLPENIKTLGIVGFILSFVFMPIGLVLSIVSLAKSNGCKNGFALAGIIVSIVKIVLTILIILFYMSFILTVNDKPSNYANRNDYKKYTTVYNGASF